MQHPKYPNLFSKGKVGKLTVKNRVIRNSMGTYLNIGKTCDLSDRNLKHAAEAAEGGPGIVFLDNCLIMESYHMGLAAYDDTYIPGLSMLAEAMHDHGAIAGMQLAHPGRDMGFAGGDDAVAPSAVLPEIMINAGAAIPRPLTIDEIYQIEDQYGKAALRVKQAGFDLVEVHGACGCLPCNFLSPHDNQRNDIYGGSLFNRQRFLVETIRAIKRYVGPDFPVSVKLDMDDCEPDGIRLDECIDTCKVLEREGVALLNLVTATHVTANFSTSFYPWSYCADMAAKVKEQVHIPVMVTGAIQSPEAAEKILADGKVDFVGTARQCLADQAWVEKARTGHEEDIRPCIRCQIGCTDRGILGHHPISCATNPTLFHYYEELYPKAETPKNVAVVGAGPAGCEAALTLKKRGHNVVISAGFLNRPGFAEKLEEISDMAVYMAGDCKKVAEIPDATHAGYAVARMV